MRFFSQTSHKIFQKNIDTKLNIRIKRWFAVKQAPSWGSESQTAPSSFYYAVTSQGERSVTLGIRYRTTLTKTGIDGYGVPVRNDIFVNAMMFPDMSLPPRCRPFLPKRRQRGGCHYASSKDLYPGLRFAHPGLSRRNKMKTELSDSRRPCILLRLILRQQLPLARMGISTRRSQR